MKSVILNIYLTLIHRNDDSLNSLNVNVSDKVSNFTVLKFP